jgi:lysozyme
MNAGDAIIGIQELLGIAKESQVRRVGPLTRSRLELLADCEPEHIWPLSAEIPGPLVTVAPPSVRNISPKGIALVEAFEGCQLTAYQDEGGVWTIGYGHTGLQHKDGTVYRGRVITQEKADELLAYDMNQFEHRVTALVKEPLNQDQFDALVSFDFNTGGLTLNGGKPSTLLRALNLGDLAGVDAQFMVWNKVKGKAVSGLTRRRMSERRLFNSEPNYIVSIEEFNALKNKT